MRQIFLNPIHRTADRWERAVELSAAARRRLKWMAYYETCGGNARRTCRHFDISPQTFCRLEHLRYVAGDPLIARFCGLARPPTARTVANWLRQFTSATLAPLVQLNHDLVTDAIARLQLPRLTIDVDGTVVRTGATVAWAFRGFNPHHRKDPSYYPLLAHLAQTGHILRCKNRPGNVHDSKQAVAFLREVINGLRARFGRRLPLEFRMDAAFCQPAVLRLLAARGCGYAIKVGYWHWLPLKQLAADRQRWLPIAPEVSGFFHDLDIPQWNLRLRVMIYRKHVAHESPKNFQLDLFTPDDGHYEYAAVATNRSSWKFFGLSW